MHRFFLLRVAVVRLPARRPEQIAQAYAHLGDSVVRIAKWRILPYTVPVIERVAQLKALRLNYG
jgi:hypothetical protein